MAHLPDMCVASNARVAIVQALNRLVLSEPYDRIGVKQLIAEANVSRSTFYQHFANKDAVLHVAVAAPLGALASIVADDAQTEQVASVLAHFLENRVRAQGMLDGPLRSRIVAVLAALIMERLVERIGGPDPVGSPVPLEFVSAQLAEAQLSLVSSWLDEPSRCDRRALANSIEATTRALVAEHLAE